MSNHYRAGLRCHSIPALFALALIVVSTSACSKAEAPPAETSAGTSGATTAANPTPETTGTPEEKPEPWDDVSQDAMRQLGDYAKFTAIDPYSVRVPDDYTLNERTTETGTVIYRFLGEKYVVNPNFHSMYMVDVVVVPQVGANADRDAALQARLEEMAIGWDDWKRGPLSNIPINDTHFVRAKYEFTTRGETGFGRIYTAIIGNKAVHISSAVIPDGNEKQLDLVDAMAHTFSKVPDINEPPPRE